MGSKGMEYRAKSNESPFETFLRYTNEKEKSSVSLASVLQKTSKHGKILDIGTGNGEYLALTLSKMGHLEGVELTLVEPSNDLSKQLLNRLSNVVGVAKVKFSPVDFDSFLSEDRFDVIIASHIFYHIPRVDWQKSLEKMLYLLKPEGRLILVLS